MIANDDDLDLALQRLYHLQKQLARLRSAEASAYHVAAFGFLTEIDRMHSEARLYLSKHSSETRPPQPERTEASPAETPPTETPPTESAPVEEDSE